MRVTGQRHDLRAGSGIARQRRRLDCARGGSADRKTVDARDHVRVPPDDPCYTLRRLWLTKEQENGYYNGTANEGLWPLCHMAFTRPVFNPRHWPIYRQVNELFARAVLEEAEHDPAFVFVQDYHYGLLPRILKELNPNLIVGHFWHIPWPSPEVFQAFPWKEELLDGLLGNDLLGFHLRHHCQNFLDTVDRTLEARVDYEHFEITRGGKVTVRPGWGEDWNARPGRSIRTLSPEKTSPSTSIRFYFAAKSTRKTN